MMTKLVRRLLRSRVATAWLSRLPLRPRRDVVSDLWQSANRGLGLPEKIELMGLLSEDRRVFGYPLVPSSLLLRAHGLFTAVDRVREVEGDIVEAGVGRGVGFACLVYASAHFGLKGTTLYAFDSFEGFPAATEEDLGGRVTTTGHLDGWADTSPDTILRALAVDSARAHTLIPDGAPALRFVRGYFHKTMPDSLPERIALLHADCDLYGSYVTVLKHCLPRMTRGGLVVFDEYGDERWPGATIAIDEACERHGFVPKYFEAADRWVVEVP